MQQPMARFLRALQDLVGLDSETVIRRGAVRQRRYRRIVYGAVRRPRPATMERIAAGFGIPPQEFRVAAARVAAGADPVEEARLLVARCVSFQQARWLRTLVARLAERFGLESYDDVVRLALLRLALEAGVEIGGEEAR
ncbi:MAG: hypothetical protein NZ761_06240 [Dehalococcoidia bacterium]|nr:hypothetical protein [Dehalococcoidia bacterium]